MLEVLGYGSNTSLPPSAVDIGVASGVCFMTVRRSIGRSGFLLMVSFIIWCVWVVISSTNSQYAFEITSPYLVTPVVLVVGIVAGGFLRRWWRRGALLQLLMVVVLVVAVSVPIYANASAAVGGLFIALAGLATLDLRESMESTQLGHYRASAAEPRALLQAIVVALTFCAGVLLVLGSQAAIALSLPVSVIVAFSVWKHTGPPQWTAVVLGCLVSAVAAIAVMFLGSRMTWPSWLTGSESLSSARHTLWADALSLWATEPLLGAGPGAFTPSSELASSVPSLAAAHSLILQVGAELGAVGVILLAAQLLGGFLFAARGSRPVVLIAIAAWTALAVHSSIDHLEDFPIVDFMGGIILGWSGLDARSSNGTKITENVAGRE